MVAILSLTAFIYWPGLHGGYAFDDYPNIVLNQALHVKTLAWRDWLAAAFSSHSSDLQRPLAMLSFAAQHYFTALDPLPMKLVNVLIHLLNSLLVFGLVRSLCRSLGHAIGPDDTASTTALFATAFWAVAPINLTAVLFIVQRMENLCHTFVLAGLWLYIHGRTRQRQGLAGRGHILAGLVFGTSLGVLSKESAALLPLYAAIVELVAFKFRGPGGSRDRWLVWLFILLLVVPAIIAVNWLLPRAIGPGAYGSREFTLAERLLTEPRVVLDYLRWCLLPHSGQMGLYHDDYVISRSLSDPGTTWVAILSIAAMLALAWWLRQTRPLASIGMFWFFSAQVMTATFLPLELVFEHRNYFASLGAALATTDLLVVAMAGAQRAWIGTLSAVLLLAYHASGTWIRANEWRDPLTFARAEALRHPQSPRATYQLGQTYVILGRGDPSSPFVDAAFTALEKARHVPKSGILPAQGLLLLSSQVGRPPDDEWWRDIERELRSHPIGPQQTGALAALTDCAIAGICPFPPEKMYPIYNAALSHGVNAEVMNIVGNYLLNVEGDHQTALRYWRKSSAMEPRNAQYRINLSSLLIAMGRHEEAKIEVGALRRIGLFGQNEAAARRFETQLAQRASKPE